MITDKILMGKGVYLRQITLQDCTNRYVEWLNDTEVNQYLETRWSVQDLQAIKEFVSSQRKNNHSILFAIMYNDSYNSVVGKHIGNIKIGSINRHHNHADISYFIGEKNFWNKGIATEVIGLVRDFGFKELGLHRIEAGVYSTAVGSWKALEKNGFKREGVFREQVMSDSNYIDVYRYGILKSESFV